MPKSISYWINRDKEIIECKKIAKKIKKLEAPAMTLMQCQNLAAKHLNYLDWHDLHSNVKKRYSFIFKPTIYQLSSQWETIFNNAILNNATYVYLTLIKNQPSVTFRKNGVSYIYKEPLNTIIGQEAFDYFCGTKYTYDKYKRFSSLQKLEHGGKKYTLLGNWNCKSQDEQNLTIQIIQEKIPRLSELNYSISQINTLHEIMNKPHNRLLISNNLEGEKKELMYSLIDSLKYEKVDISCIRKVCYPNLEGIREISITVDYKENTDELAFDRAYEEAKKEKSSIFAIEEIIQPQQLQYFIAPLNNSSIVSNFNSNSSIETLMNWKKLLVDKSKIGLSHIIHQKKVPILCPNCSLSKGIIENKDIKTSLKNYDLKKLRFINREGCAECHHTGTVSEFNFSELVIIDEKIKTLVYYDHFTELEAYIKQLHTQNPIMKEFNNGESIREKINYKIIQGIIDPNLI